MSIFPTFQEENSEEIKIVRDVSNEYKEPIFDFETKRMIIKDGKVTYGNIKRQIQQWITLLIHTETDKFNVYKNTEFGMTDLYNLRGHQYLTTSFGISEIKREIKEKIEKNERIEEVTDIEVTSSFNSLKIEITVVINEQKITTEVNLDV